MIKLHPDKDIKVEKVKIGKVPALILRPLDVPSSHVAVLWIHGGGYMLGMKEMVYMSRAIDLIRMHGVTVISPGYRLSWQKPYPAAFDDCYSVLKYVDRHKADFHVERLMVGGESAGGGLCAAVCIAARDNGIHISYQMPLYPMLSNFDTDSSCDNHGKVWNTRLNHLGWKLYLRKNAHKKVSPYASPSQQTDYSNLPPCYTFIGDGEPFYQETLQYIDDLNKAGVEASVDVYHTNIHAFDMLFQDKSYSKIAINNFLEHFEYAMKNYR